MLPKRLLPLLGFWVLGWAGTAQGAGSVPPAFSGCVESAQALHGVLEGDVRPSLEQGAFELPEPVGNRVQELRSHFGECANIDSESGLKEEFLHLFQTTSRFTEALRFASLTGDGGAQAMAKQALERVLQKTNEIEKLAGLK